MYKQRPIRDKKGKVLFEAYQSSKAPNTRIVPDRRWFGNTRVVGQKQLEQFREEMTTKVNDNYTVLLKQKTLPMALIQDAEAGKARRVQILGTQTFDDTFGKKAQRKRPKLAVDSYEDLLKEARHCYPNIFTCGTDPGNASSSVHDGSAARVMKDYPLFGGGD